MGQEASVPANYGDSLEEQARAPPSHTSDGDAINGGNRNGGLNGQTNRNSRKIMGAMFRHGNNSSSTSGGNGNAHNSHTNQYDFEQRESSRAAALGGHMYMNDGTSDDFANGSASSSLQQQQLHHVASYQEHGPQQGYSEQPNTPVTAPQQSNGSNMQQQQQQQSLVSVLFEKQSSAKKGLFSKRGVINTMRNLTITGALRKQKEVSNWEKQWDEDDDEDDDAESDEADGDARVSSPQHGGDDHYGAVVSPSPVSSMKSPAATSPPHQSARIQTGLEYGASIITPVVQNNLQYETTQQPIPGDTSTVSQLSPPRTQHHIVSLSSSSPSGELLNKIQEPIADDLLSKSIISADTLISQQLQPQQYHVVEDDSSVWDSVIQQPPGMEDTESKPSVQMFMPMLRVLGKGSFGKVVLVQKREGKERGQLFAMKILKKTHLVKRRQIERTRTERKVLSVVNHPFIMKLHYAFQSEDKLYLVLDYCPGGELFFHLSRFRRFPERVARFYAAELLLAIGHLHKRGIIYRDLKPENVLLDAEGHLKLGDFGLAKSGITHPLTGATSMCGTPEYMAPEVLAQSGHGFCVDYWGLGMIVYEMMTGLPPWYTTDRAQLFRRLKSAPLEIPTYFSAASANCVSALLERNPRRRLGVSGIRTAMEHEFFRNISWRALYSRRVEAPVRPCEGWKPPEPLRDDDDHDVLQSTNNGFSGPVPSSGYKQDFEHLDSVELDSATQNFDNQFTRMPVESEDPVFDPAAEGIGSDELNEETFLGFSFDIVKHREEEATMAALENSNSMILGSHSASNSHLPSNA